MYAQPPLLRRRQCVPRQSGGARLRAASAGLARAAGHLARYAAQYRRAGARGAAMHATRFLSWATEMIDGTQTFTSPRWGEGAKNRVAACRSIFIWSAAN